MREPNILHKYLRRYILFRLKKCVFIFFLNLILFWITLSLSSDCRLSSLGARLTLMSEYLLGGSFKLSLVAVCRIYFICDGKINNRSSNYWESGVYSSSVFDWVPSPPDPLSHWDLWSEQKQWETQTLLRYRPQLCGPANTHAVKPHLDPDQGAGDLQHIPIPATL